MSEWKRTTFEWPQGAMERLPVTAYPGLTLTIHEVKVEKGPYGGLLGDIDIEFDATQGNFRKDDKQISDFIWRVADEISTSKDISYPRIRLLIGHESGVAITTTMSQKVRRLFELCGIQIPGSPRIVAETFFGQSRDDWKSLGKVLFGF